MAPKPQGKEEQDNIDEFAATLEEQTGISNAKQLETEELGELIRSLDKEMVEITARREKEKAKYEATAADLSKAVSSLEGAIADMQAGKGASFLSVKKGIRKSIAIASQRRILCNADSRKPETRPANTMTWTMRFSFVRSAFSFVCSFFRLFENI